MIPVDGVTYFAATWTAEVWIDESTYLPVRSTMTNDEKTSQVTDFAWLPRTNASLTKYGLRGNMPIRRDPRSRSATCSARCRHATGQPFDLRGFILGSPAVLSQEHSGETRRAAQKGRLLNKQVA